MSESVHLEPSPTPSASTETQIFRVSPLIQLTLLSLYGALTLPLPVLARFTHAPVPPIFLSVGLGLGAIALYAALSEQVTVTRTGIQVGYPRWFSWFWRKGWFLPWADIQALKPRSTGQGGLVYYFVTHTGEARLLPMRVVGFNRLVQRVQAQTGIDTTDVRPLSQPWMYLILLVLTLLLWLVDGWTLWTALSLGGL